MPIELTFKNTDKGNEALETIKNYIKHNAEYPRCYIDFFKNWSFINPLYNACSDKTDCEPCRVIDFGAKNETILWNDSIEQYTRDLVSLECVGDGKNNSHPDIFVKTATLHLRRELYIDDVCSHCRKGCNHSEVSDYDFNKLDATMRILYQIRCNLFHGDKTELEGKQGDRNKELVDIGDKILNNIFQRLADD